MKKTAFFLAFLMLSGCSKTPEKKSGLVLINVLDKEHFDDAHLPGSLHVDVDNLEGLRDVISSEAEVVAYCSNYLCSASEFACKRLTAMGFNAKVYQGGTAEWFQAGLPVEGPHRKIYLTKKLAPTQAFDCPVISIHELAEKMGLKLQENAAA